MDSPASESAPKILENLVAAGLVSHELIGDPARLGTETAALAALCARVAGPVYRLGAFHYAFRIGSGDLDGALASVEPAARGEALAAALAAELGPEAVWVNAADLVADAEAGFEARQLLFLKAADGAAAAALAEAPELAAVVNATIAARSAETAATLAGEAIDRAARAAGAEGEALARAVGMLAARIEGIEAGLKEAVGAAAGEAVQAVLGEAGGGLRQAAAEGARAAEPALGRIADALATLAERLEDQARRQQALETAIAGLAAAETGRAPALAAFEERLGLTLAEFLAASARPQGAAPQVVETGAEPRPAPPAKGRTVLQPAAQLG